ncbi:MAG: DF family (seleno)protein [Microbacterium sp.]|uniref:DF family (seleno)protein n=1 Tax=Microbacterium sp. TaxID=51671 RepID=UPI003D6FCB54
MTVELLYIAGCPNFEIAARKLHDELTRFGVTDEIELRLIRTAEEAERERFLGSPTIRIDSRDVDPNAQGRTDYGLKCRLYRSGTATAGVPPESWIAAAVGAARRGRRG